MTPEEKRDYMREWRAANKERIAAYQREWFAAHPGYHRERYAAKTGRSLQEVGRRPPPRSLEDKRTAFRNWYAVNRDAVLARKSRYREANREAIAAAYREWQRVNRAKKAANENRRRARIAQCQEHHTEEEWRALLALFGGCCALCGSTAQITRDHIIPLTKGGSDGISNIQPLCRGCNARKGNRL